MYDATTSIKWLNYLDDMKKIRKSSFLGIQSMKMSTSNVPQYSLLICLEDQIRSIGFVVDSRVVVILPPSTGHEEGSVGHRTASSSEALRL